MKKVQFRLRELIALKERKEECRITYRVLHNETGINLNTITAMANNKMQMVGLQTIARLLDYFSCKVADLIIYEESEARNV